MTYKYTVTHLFWVSMQHISGREWEISVIHTLSGLSALICISRLFNELRKLSNMFAWVAHRATKTKTKTLLMLSLKLSYLRVWHFQTVKTCIYGNRWKIPEYFPFNLFTPHVVVKIFFKWIQTEKLNSFITDWGIETDKTKKKNQGKNNKHVGVCVPYILILLYSV